MNARDRVCAPPAHGSHKEGSALVIPPIGARFGYLEVIGIAKASGRVLVCRCRCGASFSAPRCRIVSQKIVSCGCESRVHPKVRGDAKVDIELLERSISYDRHTGVFRWLVNSGKATAGTEAGHFDPKGYMHIGFKGAVIPAHRLAWRLVAGRWPVGVIDHINGIPHDNRFSNLRDVDQKTNSQNRTVTNNATGFMGVGFHQGRYRADFVMPDGKKKYLGSRDTPEEANQLFLAYKRKFHDGCTL